MITPVPSSAVYALCRFLGMERRHAEEADVFDLVAYAVGMVTGLAIAGPRVAFMLARVLLVCLAKCAWAVVAGLLVALLLLVAKCAAVARVGIIAKGAAAAAVRISKPFES